MNEMPIVFHSQFRFRFSRNCFWWWLEGWERDDGGGEEKVR